MASDFFTPFYFEKSNIFYTLISLKPFSKYHFIVIFGLILLSWGILKIAKFYDQKFMISIWTSKVFNAISSFGVLILAILAGYFYEGIWSVWVTVVLTLGFLLAVIDSKIQAVPDWMNFALVFLSALGVILQDSFRSEFLDGFSMAGLFAILKIFGDMICKQEILGEGDIVFFASCGFLFGVYDSLVGLFWGCIFGCVYVGIHRLFGKKISKIPLITFVVPGLAFGFMLGILNG